MQRRGFSRSKRFRGDWGVSLTEYAVVFAVLAVGTLAATQYLGAEAENETEQQATCVSERPPPPSCQIPTAATSTTTTISPGPSSSTTSTPVTAPPPTPGSVVTGAGTVTSGTAPGPWQLSFPVTSVRDGDGVPVAGVVVRFAIYISDGTTTIFSGDYASCTTDALGSCTATYTQTPETGVTIVQAVVTDIENLDPEPTFSTTPIPVTLP